jgi:hypothetical protein
LNADGSVDTSFNPGVDVPNLSFAPGVYGLAVQSDGKIMVGGEFGRLGGQPRANIGRLTSPSAALQTLDINASGTTVTWTRSGAGPEVEQVTFAQSTDGTNYKALGSGIRISGGWQLTGLSLPAGQNFFLRARGRSTGGAYGGSSGLIESVAQFYRLAPPFLSAPKVLGGGAFQFAFSNPSAASFTVLATTNAVAPIANWELLAPAISIGGGVYQFTDPAAANYRHRFYLLRWP